MEKDNAPAPKQDDIAQAIAQALYDKGHLSLGPAYIPNAAEIIRAELTSQFPDPVRQTDAETLAWQKADEEGGGK